MNIGMISVAFIMGVVSHILLCMAIEKNLCFSDTPGIVTRLRTLVSHTAVSLIITLHQCPFSNESQETIGERLYYYYCYISLLLVVVWLLWLLLLLWLLYYNHCHPYHHHFLIIIIIIIFIIYAFTRVLWEIPMENMASALDSIGV